MSQYQQHQYPDPYSSYPPHNAQSSRYSYEDLPLAAAPLATQGASHSRSGYGIVRDEKDSAEYNVSQGKGRRWGKWIVVGLVLLILVGIAVGIAVWKTRPSGSTSSSGSGSEEYIEGTAKVVKSNPNDPSQFEKDPRLHLSFDGFAYTPFLAQKPWCGITQKNVTEDIQLLSQLTNKIRTYGSACNQSSIVLQAIADTKVNMTVWLGIYIGPNETVNTEQFQYTLTALKNYGTDHVSGVTVGNEYILNEVDQAAATTYIVNKMADFRTQLEALNLPKKLPVGTADAGSVITAPLAAGADYIMANVHPFFGGLPIGQAANWTWDYFHINDVSVTDAAPNRPQAYIAETGWPTGVMAGDEANATIGGAVAGLSGLQTYLDTFVCQANRNATGYFFFEAFDEPWKEMYGGTEPYWGIMDSNKRLKNLTLPTCLLTE